MYACEYIDESRFPFEEDTERNSSVGINRLNLDKLLQDKQKKSEKTTVS